MKHSLKISYTKEPGYGGIVWCRTVPLRERLLRRLFGEMRRVTIIVPGDSVEEFSVKEVGRMRKKVFICSPFRGDMEGNAKKAAVYSRMACEEGYLPIAPHLLFPQ